MNDCSKIFACATPVAQEPRLPAVAVITLALASGANTTMFSHRECDAASPFPFPHLDRIVSVGIGSSKTTTAWMQPREFFGLE